MELVLDKLNLFQLRLNRIFRGLEKAAREGKLVHLWAHPWEFRTPKDLEKLDVILRYVSNLISRGTMQSMTMTDMAKLILSREQAV